MSQFIPPNLMHPVGGTWTYVAGLVAGTIALHRAAHNSSGVVNIPIVIPSNSVALQGAKLKSVEIDFEIATAVVTSAEALIYKVTRGANLAVAVVSTALPMTYSPAYTETLKVEQHKLVLTLTTPIFLRNTEYVLVEFTIVAGAGGGTQKILGAVANYTLRV
jgi:hypothetical protein